MDKVLAVVNKDVVLASQQEAPVQKVKASAQRAASPCLMTPPCANRRWIG